MNPIPVLYLIFSVTLAKSLYEGDFCGLKNGDNGFCTPLADCQPVKQQLKLGNFPANICGYTGFDPIVCCPKNAPTNTTTPRIGVPEDPKPGSGRAGAITDKKCTEYARYAYVLKIPPTITIGHPINVTECNEKKKPYVGSYRNSYPKEFPHMAAIGYGSNSADIIWQCNGALISETFILTAAHCAYSSRWGNATWIRVGDLDLYDEEDGYYAVAVNRRITERIIHPEYRPPSQYHDIALLRLESGVPFNSWIRPACLHSAQSTETEKAVVTRWGEPDDECSNNLKMSELTLVDTQTCKANWTCDRVDINMPNGVIGDWSICASTIDDNSCQGNTGAPLIMNNKNFRCMYDVVGILSLENTSGIPIPGIYTRVYHYITWIESTVWPQG